MNSSAAWAVVLRALNSGTICGSGSMYSGGPNGVPVTFPLGLSSVGVSTLLVSSCIRALIAALPVGGFS